MNKKGTKIFWIDPRLPEAEQKTLAMDKLKHYSIVDANGCWIWQGTFSLNGYGQTSFQGNPWRSHRLAFFLAKGAIPDGHDVCHSCDIRACCNPDHLWTGTRKENMRDCSAKGRADGQWKTHCMRGHEFTPDNTYIARGLRHCKACQRGRLRVKGGWPEDLAYSMAVVPHGYRPVNAKKFRRKAA